MSNIQAAAKVADQIISRIFDQRQFTTGEINYLAREFGEKAKLEENFDKILKLNENVCVVADTDIYELSHSGEQVVKDLSSKVNSLHTKTERLLKLEDEQRQRESALLLDMRAERSKVEQDCRNKTKSKLEDLMKTLEEEEADLERKYLKFEENLRHNK